MADTDALPNALVDGLATECALHFSENQSGVTVGANAKIWRAALRRLEVKALLLELLARAIFAEVTDHHMPGKRRG